MAAFIYFSAARTPRPRTLLVVPLIRTVLSRSKSFKKARIEEQSVSLLAGAFLWRQDKACEDFINATVSGLPTCHDVVLTMIEAIRETLTVEASDPSYENVEQAHKHAADLLVRIAKLAAQQFGEITTRQRQASDEEVQGLARLVDSIARTVYTVSGAFDAKQQHAKTSPPTPAAARLYAATHEALQCVAQSAVPSATHSLLESLEHLAPVDPPGVFLLTATAVVQGRRSGVQFESLAVDVAVRIVERYLADYRDLLANDEQCRLALVDVLDAFIEVGWPAARRLAYRLDEVYR